MEVSFVGSIVSYLNCYCTCTYGMCVSTGTHTIAHRRSEVNFYESALSFPQCDIGIKLRSSG